MRTRGIWIAALLTAALALPAAGGKKELKARYEGKTFVLGHNLWVQNEDVSWVNFMAIGDYIPLGTRVTVTRVKKDELIFTVEGRDGELELDLDDALPGAEAVVERIFVAEAPSTEGLSEIDRKGIETGKILEGMSRRAVFLAVGYPPYSYTPPFKAEGARNHDVDAPELRYMKSRFDMLIVRFDDADRVKAIKD